MNDFRIGGGYNDEIVLVEIFDSLLFGPSELNNRLIEGLTAGALIENQKFVYIKPLKSQLSAGYAKNVTNLANFHHIGELIFRFDIVNVIQ